MANPFKGAMSFFGLSSAEEEDQDLAEYDQKQGEGDSTFDEDANVTPGPAFTSREGSSSSLLSPSPSPRSRMNRITTIHPKTYEEAQLVGRALRDGVPVVLNLTDDFWHTTQPLPQRVLEIVGNSPDELAGARERFRAYRDAGFTVEHHNMQGKAV